MDTIDVAVKCLTGRKSVTGREKSCHWTEKLDRLSVQLLKANITLARVENVRDIARHTFVSSCPDIF